MRNSGTWFCLTLCLKDNYILSPVVQDVVSSLLIELGSPGTELTSTSITGYFPSRDQAQLAQQKVEQKSKYFKQNAISSSSFSYEISEVMEQNWKTQWKDYFSPIHLGPRVTIIQPWGDYHLRDKEIVITINPQQAFGTGLHESTRLLLRLIEKHLQPGSTFLDVGCGTGIASILAAKLNVCSVTAIDNDDEAVKSARWHVRKNNVAQIVKVKKTDLVDLKEAYYDVVAVNIEWKILSHLMDVLPNFVKYEGKLLISGITNEETIALQDSLRKNRMQWGRMLKEGEWTAVMAKFKKSLLKNVIEFHRSASVLQYR